MGQQKLNEYSERQHPPLYLEDENIFQKSATFVVIQLQLCIPPTWPILTCNFKNSFFPVWILCKIGRYR
jgi:hypothetical protein